MRKFTLVKADNKTVDKKELLMKLETTAKLLLQAQDEIDEIFQAVLDEE